MLRSWGWDTYVSGLPRSATARSPPCGRGRQDERRGGDGATLGRMPINGWLRHLPAAVDPLIDDAWLELFGHRDRATRDLAAPRPESPEDRRSQLPVLPVVQERGPATRPRRRQ